MNNDKPLVTVCFTCYNRKKYVAEAFRSVLEQTYSPLEIVVSDNCSTDGTKEIVLDLIQEYQNGSGSHKIVFNSNDSNIGLIKNIEKCYRMAHGELIVSAHDDDISLPDRVEVITNEWIKNGKKATVIFHGLFPMSIDGEILKYEWWRQTVRNPLGAAMAYSPIILSEKFPDINATEACDDNIFVRRAYAFGDILYIEEKLIKYRLGAGTTTTGSYFRRRQRISNGKILAARQNLIDIGKIKTHISSEKYDEIRELALEIIDTYGVELGYNPIRKFVSYCKSCKRFHRRWYSIEWLFKDYLGRGYPMIFGPLINFARKLMRRYCRK